MKHVQPCLSLLASLLFVPLAMAEAPVPPSPQVMPEPVRDPEGRVIPRDVKPAAEKPAHASGPAKKARAGKNAHKRKPARAGKPGAGAKRKKSGRRAS